MLIRPAVHHKLQNMQTQAAENVNVSKINII